MIAGRIIRTPRRSIRTTFSIRTTAIVYRRATFGVRFSAPMRPRRPGTFRALAWASALRGMSSASTTPRRVEFYRRRSPNRGSTSYRLRRLLQPRPLFGGQKLRLDEPQIDRRERNRLEAQHVAFGAGDPAFFDDNEILDPY